MLSVAHSSKETLPADPSVVLQKRGAMWTNIAADNKQPCEKKAARLKGKTKRIWLPTEPDENPDAVEKGVARAEGRQWEEEDDEDVR